MKLKIKDRLTISSLFPKSSGILEQLMVKEITDKVALTSDDFKNIEMKEVNGALSWNDEKDKGLDVDFSDSQMNFLKDQVARLDSAKEITQENVGICVSIKEFKKESKK